MLESWPLTRPLRYFVSSPTYPWKNWSHLNDILKNRSAWLNHTFFNTSCDEIVIYVSTIPWNSTLTFIDCVYSKWPAVSFSHGESQLHRNKFFGFLKFSPPNMLFPYLQRIDWELWSSGVGYRIQETCPKSAVVKTSINWKREGCSEQVWGRKHWFLQSTSFQPSSLLWMVRRLCPQALVIPTFHSTSLLIYSRSVTLKNTKSFIQLLGP